MDVNISMHSQLSNERIEHWEMFSLQSNFERQSFTVLLARKAKGSGRENRLKAELGSGLILISRLRPDLSLTGIHSNKA